jgi:UDP-N-acetylmuramoylalanine--D-glutamate ligase
MDFKDKRVTVMGLGVFSGGVEVARFFVRKGACVTVTDQKDRKALAVSVKQLCGLPVRLVLGKHRMEDFTQADLVVVNPAVPDHSPYLAAARQHKVAQETEMNLIFKLAQARLAGVTGSNGKSTTTALLGAMFQKAGRRAVVGGNIGRSLINSIERLPASAWAVLELSSFQLEALARTGKSPRVAVVTNLSPNHLDRHGSARNYYRAKRAIIDHQGPHDITVLNYDDKILRGWAKHCRGRVYWFSVKQRVPQGCYLHNGQVLFVDRGRVRRVAAQSAILLPGLHNIANCLAAAAAALATGMPARAVQQVFRTFRGIEHRLELVRTLRGVRYYNDSIATTPESVIAALRSFSGRIVLIAGGYDKKIPFDDLARLAARKVAVLVLVGATRQTIARAVEKYRRGPVPEVQFAASFPAAVRSAAAAARPGSVVLLSPACASYDMFNNFVERGRLFKELVHRLC